MGLMQRRRRAPRGFLSLLVLAALGTVPAANAVEPFVFEGSIAAPQRFPLDVTYSTWPGGQRQVWANTQALLGEGNGLNGAIGYTFRLPADYAGGTFELVALNPPGPLDAVAGIDLDVTFYSTFAPVESPGNYVTRQPGGEAGAIPDGTQWVIVTMYSGADADFRFTAVASEEAVEKARGLKPAPMPAAPGIHPAFGLEGDRVAAWAKRLRNRSHVVIAVVDTGINPYHITYRRPEYTIHPSHYIEGFPADVPALGLSLDAASYRAAREGDDGPVWSQVGNRKLYWIPGTNIVGAYSVSDEVDPALPPPSWATARPIIDDNGHGTGTSSVAAGDRTFKGGTYGSNPEALIVVIEGLGDEAVAWAASQPWIDFISGSYGDPVARPCSDQTDTGIPLVDGEVCPSREYRFTAPFVLRDGRTACFSAGNGLSRTGVATDRYSSLRPTSGPSWVVSVGAVSPRNGQDYGWHSVPVDLSSYGLHWPAAAPYSKDGEVEFGGTSNATPVACGAFSKALLEARRALGDALEGIHVTADGTRVPALGRPTGQGLLADGVLTRVELQDAMFKTAQPGGFDPDTYADDPVVIPDTPLYFTQEGYGIANVASAQRASAVIAGTAAMPARPEVDAWIAAIDVIRDTLYPPPQFGP